MFLVLKSKNVKETVWIIDSCLMKTWGGNGIESTKEGGYRIYKDGRVEKYCSHFYVEDIGKDLIIQVTNTLEEAKKICYSLVGYVPPLTVGDMNQGEVFTVMYKDVETKCMKLGENVICLDGKNGGMIVLQSGIPLTTPIVKRYKLEEVK